MSIGQGLNIEELYEDLLYPENRIEAIKHFMYVILLLPIIVFYVIFFVILCGILGIIFGK